MNIDNTEQTNISGVDWKGHSDDKQDSRSDLTGEDSENRANRERETLNLEFPLNMRRDGHGFYLCKNLRHGLELMNFDTEFYVDFSLDMPSHSNGVPRIIVVPISSQDLDEAYRPKKISWSHDHGTKLRLPKCLISKTHGGSINLGIDSESYTNNNRLVFRVWQKPESFALCPTRYENGDVYRCECRYMNLLQRFR